MENIQKILEKVNQMPNSPGIYKFISNGNIVYIGKSKKLKTRVSSYFRKNHERKKIYIMMKNVDDIEYELTDTHLEARLLEFRLIRKYLPIYNSQFKIKKTQWYLDFDSKKVIDISPISGIGPFIGQRFLRNFIKNIEHLFPISITNNEIKYNYNIITKRLNEKEKYNTSTILAEIFTNILFFEKFIKKLEISMNEYAKRLEFEKALFFKNLLDNVTYIREVIIDKNNFLDNKYILIDNGYYLLIEKGNIINKTRNIDNIKDSTKQNIIFPNLSYEEKNLIYSHSKEKDIKILNI